MEFQNSIRVGPGEGRLALAALPSQSRPVSAMIQKHQYGTRTAEPYVQPMADDKVPRHRIMLTRDAQCGVPVAFAHFIKR